MNMRNQTIMKRLAPLFLRQKSLLLIIVILSVTQVGLAIYLPILMGQAINVMIGKSLVNFSYLMQILQQMAIVIAISAIVQWINPQLYNRLILKMMTTLRQEMLEKIHQIPMQQIDRLSTGDLVTRVISDIEQLSDGLTLIFSQFGIGILTIVVTIGSMARLDWLMMLLVVALTPLSLFFARFIAQRSYRLFRKQTSARGRHGQMVEETIQQLEIVRVFNGQEETLEKFKLINDEYAYHSQDAIYYSSITNPGTRFINAVIYAILTFIATMRIIRGTFTVGELTTFLNYVNQYTKPFNDISSVFSEIQGAFACAERLFEIFDMPVVTQTGQQQINQQQLKGAIAFNDVSFSYEPEQPLITNLNVAIHPGQKVAIVGPTGAGKSTLINLLMRFYEVDRGAVLIDGEPITQYTRDSLRQNFGMVLQETWLKTGTIHENIAYGYPNATRELVIEAAKAARAHHFIEQLPNGYDTYLADGGESLSIGQQQLLSIARLFVKVPQLLILDEATSSIDTRTEVLIQQAFDLLMKGRTSFIIAHRLSTIQTADLILVMQDGDIIEQGNHEQLMLQRGLYYQMQQTRNPVS
ncbi:ABC transporter ATP-binding protein [Aerococcaceae bacterium zg-BR22]|uniref:ABC transporter ATP-binding protein n=1 Tax=Aerococcaceae bacterium zg-1292 TaxID=2774330 RepID=UPI00406408CC|nr:ABC transporter ATP-binding protein [Aerococcaceae bacterium zg-BR22]